MDEFEFEVLTGLPATGKTAIAFPPGSLGFSEGLVVGVRCESSETWIGNFSNGETDHSAVYKHPDGKRLIVIAGGSDYLVDPFTKELLAQIASDISFSRDFPALGIVVFGDNTAFWAEGKVGRAWTTPRISWDGLADINVTEDILTGNWYSAIDEGWHEFSLILSSGKLVGETYEDDFRRATGVAPQRI